MRLERAEIYHISIPMVKPFVTARGVETEQQFLIIKLFAEGAVGIGECSAGVNPQYSCEAIATCKPILIEFLLPGLLGKNIDEVDDLVNAMSRVIGNHMAKSSVEQAYWDLLSQQKGQPIYKLLGGTKKAVDAGAAIGIFSTAHETLQEIDTQLAKGFKRLKLKISPGHDYKILKVVRSHVGKFPLMVDANCSYNLTSAGHQLKRLDALDLTQIEQPLAHDDLIDHANLQKELLTPICLDESIVHVRAAGHAIELQSCRIINVKLSRVGGMSEAKKIHDLCVKHNIGVWAGSMISSGIGLVYDIIYASLPGINYPSDIQESGHYMIDDIVDPPVSMSADGTFDVPQVPGLGVRLDEKKMKTYLIDMHIIS